MAELDDEPKMCPNCEMIFPKHAEKWNDYNKHKHIKNCKINNRGIKPITNFFSPRTKRKNDTTDEVIHNYIDLDNEVETNCIISHPAAQLISPVNAESPRKKLCAYPTCRGFKPLENMKDFPFHRILDEQSNLKFDYFNNALHHKSCIALKCLILDENDNGNGINPSCEELKYNTKLKTLIKNVKCDSRNLNYDYLTHDQLVKRCKANADKINKLSLESLNSGRTIMSLRAKQSSYKRLVNLIGMGEFAAVNRVISVCLKNKYGVEGIISKINSSIEGAYK